jgi:Helicase conserved C-terminal domain
MRHLNVDWHSLIGRLDTWASLAPESRRAYLQLKPNQYLRRGTFDHGDVVLLISEGLLAVSADRTRVRLHPGAAEFSRAMRAMRRHRFHPASDDRSIAAYASDHLTVEERRALLRDTARSLDYYDQGWSDLATQPGWIKQVLDLRSAKAALTWECDRLPDRHTTARFEDGSPYFEDESLFDATKKLLEAATTWTEPVPLAELPGRVPDVAPHLLHRAIMPAVRYLLLFAWLDGEDSLPVIGIWPQITYLLHRPAPRAPKPVEPVETFHAPVLIEDMMAALVTAAAEPLRVLAGGDGLYAKDLQRVAEAAMTLPGWLIRDADDEDSLGPPDRQRSGIEGRLSEAVQTCLNQGLLHSLEGERGRLRLEITNAGGDWLSRDMHERIRAMVDPWRDTPKPKGRAKAGRRTASLHVMFNGVTMDWNDGDNRSPWLPPRLRWACGPDVEKIDWRGAFADLLLDADGTFVPLEDLLEYHSQANNPLLGRRKQGSYGPKPRLHMFGRRDIAETELEDMWNDLAEELIAQSLVPLGAVEVGWLGKELAVRLHGIGRYMLGRAEDFDYHARPEGAVIVQPNFEVTFLGPSPRAEATIGRLAERTGSRVGTLFRITRSSILAAAAAGMNADEALRSLAEASSKPLPENVRREVHGWFNTTRRVQMRQAWLIDAPDAHTATQIAAAAGKRARLLTPTLVEITTPKKDHSTLIRKLKQSGIFVR